MGLAVHSVVLEIDGTGKYVELACEGASEAVVQARLVSGSAWTSAVLKFEGSAAERGQRWDEIDPLVRLSGEGMTRPICVAGLRRFRVTVHSASGTSQTRAELTIGLHNPNYP